jgi:hypothetical protein
MAKKRSKIKTLLFLAVLGLAAWGAHNLWHNHSEDAKTAVEKTTKAVKAAKDSLK